MKRIAVLGAGIMGACLALYLSRLGCHVTLFDKAARPLKGASRWNEGKIHLGYLYGAETTLDTAKRLAPGGLAFPWLIEDLIGAPLTHVTGHDDVYLVHRDSVVSAERVGAYFQAVSDLLRDLARPEDYFVNLSSARARALSQRECAAIADGPILAGFTAPERSIATGPLADQLEGALTAAPRIDLRMNTQINDLQPLTGGISVEGERFDWALNALWHGRLPIDAKMGLRPAPGWSHRYRVSAFINTKTAIDAPSLVVGVGPFGDMKSYGNGAHYLSWYPAGLLAEGEILDPPPTPELSEEAKRRVLIGIRDGLGRLAPAAHLVIDAAAQIEIEGGYVFAHGRGALDDPHSTLHRRSQFGTRTIERYVSIDTGKFSTAPFMARDIAHAIAEA